MDQHIKDAVNETLGTRWLGQGPRVTKFEQAIETKFNRKHAVATNSGTAALELAYHLLDIQEGDEVIVPVLTCTATNIPLLRRKAKLIFADIDSDTLCPDFDDIAGKVTENTKAIVTVNLGGIKSDLVRIDGIPVVCDSAQGTGLDGGDYCTYSFQAIKHFTTGDGGMLFTPDEESYKRAKKLRWFGIDREQKQKNDWQAYKEREMTFDIEEAGYKYQMTDIAASMGLAGLEAYDKILIHRSVLFERYRNGIENIPGIRMVDGRVNVHWLATFLVENRDDFAIKLAENGIETNLVQLRNDIFKIFGGKRQDLPNMNRLEDKYISLPLHTNMNVSDVDYVLSVIKGGW